MNDQWDQLKAGVRWSSKDERFRSIVLDGTDRAVVLRIVKCNDDGKETQLRRMTIEAGETMEEDDLVALLALHGWPDAFLRVYVVDAEQTSGRAGQLASKRFLPSPEVLMRAMGQDASVAAGALAASSTSTAIARMEPPEVSDRLIDRWNTPEGMTAIMEIVDKMVRSILPVVTETIDDISRRKMEHEMTLDDHRTDNMLRLIEAKRAAGMVTDDIEDEVADEDEVRAYQPSGHHGFRG